MNYESAYKKAVERFQALSLEEIEAFSGYTAVEQGIKINFLGQEFIVNHPEGRFTPLPDISGELPVFSQILILHYLVNSSQADESGDLVSYKELPGGNIYINPFTQRAVNPFVRIFGHKPDALRGVAQLLGAEVTSLGDFSIRIRVFPRIPVTLVLWFGDDEFPPSGNILFDSSAPFILPTEDYAVLASLLVATLKKLSEK
ncbi:MAG: DUF3786 domain-containing protein [Desulfitobacterium hafniense]|nr:DUF3786 domain-containing protein [Desulfitobacterium hafniense]